MNLTTRPSARHRRLDDRLEALDEGDRLVLISRGQAAVAHQVGEPDDGQAVGETSRSSRPRRYRRACGISTDVLGGDQFEKWERIASSAAGAMSFQSPAAPFDTVIEFGMKKTDATPSIWKRARASGASAASSLD